jgi:hypothetical protein
MKVMETMFEVIAKDTKTGISSRTREPYVIENLTLNFHGKAAKIRAPRDMKIDIGDSVILEFGTVRGYGVAQIGAIVKEVIPQEKKGE